MKVAFSPVVTGESPRQRPGFILVVVVKTIHPLGIIFAALLNGWVLAEAQNNNDDSDKVWNEWQRKSETKRERERA